MAKKVKRKASAKKGLKAKPPAKKSTKRKAAKAIKKKVSPRKIVSVSAKRSVPAKVAKPKSPSKKLSSTGIHEAATQPVFVEQNAVPVQPSYEPVTPAVNKNQPSPAPENSANDESGDQLKE